MEGSQKRKEGRDRGKKRDFLPGNWEDAEAPEGRGGLGRHWFGLRPQLEGRGCSPPGTGEASLPGCTPEDSQPCSGCQELSLLVVSILGSWLASDPQTLFTCPFHTAGVVWWLHRSLYVSQKP